MKKELEIWNKLYSKQKARPKYPNEQVVRFVFKNLGPGQRVLDLGCGAGWHTVFLAENGFEAYGLDFSELAVHKLEGWLQELGLTAVCKVAPAEQLPFEDNFFDALISCGSLYYGDEEEIKRRINEIYRVLKPGGLAWISIRSLDDSRFGTGTQIEPHTFIVQESLQSRSAFEENGMKMHFFSKEELKTLSAEFSNITIDKMVITREDGTYQDDELLAVLKK